MTMETPKNETPPAMSSFVDTLFGLLSSYGWHLVFAVVIINLLWSNLRPRIQKLRDRRQNQQREEEYLQHPEKLISLQEALEASRRKLQEQHDRLAREHAEKLKQAEEEKRQEKIKKWESVQSGSSFGPQVPSEPDSDTQHVSRSSQKSKRLRGQDYNPLMGSSSGACFRPSRRGGGSIGG